MDIRVLGPLEVWAGGRKLEIGGGRQRALLAMLVLHLDEAVSSDRLIDELWVGKPPPTAPKALQNLVVQLRKAFDPVADGVLVTQPPGYRLRLDGSVVDAHRFEQLAAEGRRALVDDPARAASLLSDALSLWRGEPYAEFAFRDFARPEIERLNELELGVTEDRVDAELALGRSAELIPELEARVAANPLRERARGQLMLALYRNGRQAEALDVYREGRAILHDELGLEPGIALRQLEQAILTQDPSLGRAPRLPPPVLRRRRRWIAAVAAVLVLASAAAAALVTRRSDGSPVVVPESLVKIDAETNEIVEVIPVGRNPGDVAVVGDYVFVASEDDGTLTRVNARTGEITSSGALSADSGLAAAGDRFLWVASTDRAEAVRVDADSLLVVDRVRLPRDLAHAFLAVGGGSLWVSEYGPPALSRWQLRTLDLERRYPFATFEFPVEVTYGDGAAWLGLGASDELLRVDALDGRTRRVSAPSGAGDPVVGFRSVWVVSIDDGLWRIDPLDGKTEAIVPLGQAGFGTAIGTNAVWVVGHCDGALYRVDPERNEVVKTIELGYHPKWIAAAHGFVWVGVSGTNLLAGFGCN